jgi:hypothetical protein
MPPPDYEIMSGCVSDCDHCQLPYCPFALEDEFDEDEDIEICDYTGEECIGNPMFCEECMIVIGSIDKQIKRRTIRNPSLLSTVKPQGFYIL